jgi:hypothetical protein
MTDRAASAATDRPEEQTMQKCQVCGKENPTGVEYCEDCGASLTAPVAAPSGAAPSASDEPPGGTPPAPEPVAPAAPAGAASEPIAEPTTVPSMPTTAAPAAEAATAGPTPAPTSTQATPTGASPTGAPGPNGARPRLVVKRFGAVTGDEIPLMADRLVVGRFDSETGPVDIDLSAAAESAHVSRQHGELYREPDGRWFVRDLGSTNGVFVKAAADATFGPRLTAPRQISGGDEVAFGNARFVFKTD